MIHPTPSTGMRPGSDYQRSDFATSPYVIFYEVTRACDLVCKHCRASAQTRSAPGELTTDQSKQLLDQIATFPKPPIVVFTGGDPFKRADIISLVKYGTDIGLTMTMTPSATPLLTTDAIHQLRDAGLTRLAVSLDAADAQTHDGFRRVPGSFDRTFEILDDSHKAGLALQVNTTVTRLNKHQLDDIADLITRFDIQLWSVFLLVPVGRGTDLNRIAPEEYEEVFHTLWLQSQQQPYGIKTTEAQHYRRFVLQQKDNPLRVGSGEDVKNRMRAPLGVNDGKGVMFVGHTGEYFPSGFIPVFCGRFPDRSIVDAYQNSDVFLALRDADRLKGKCGVCEYRQICGGSRSRSYGVTGDMLAAEPDCIYIPPKWQEQQAG